MTRIAKKKEKENTISLNLSTNLFKFRFTLLLQTKFTPVAHSEGSHPKRERHKNIKT